MQVALYVRVSTTRQAESDLSIPDQLRQLRAWCENNGHAIVAEFVEPGASATDDKRPEFQKMIGEAMLKPAPYQAIIIHSLSRFFRDGIEFGVYERKLKKNGVSVISITQITSDDASGEMMRRIISLFDEHQSKENSKHTSRAMKENARQGFFNGSRAPYGFDSIQTEVNGSHGRKKKRLEINKAESDVVRLVYDLYLHGSSGVEMGCKEIAMHLNAKGYLLRGKEFRMQKIHILLSDTLYCGEYHFNVIDSKTGKKRPPEEWILTNIPIIIDAKTFEQVRVKRNARSPKVIPAARLVSTTLLTGLLKCGICGHHMTLATGKGGRYKYYKCTSRLAKGNIACTSKNLPMEKTNQLVLNELADKVFNSTRLQKMLSEYRNVLVRRMIVNKNR